MRQWIVSWAIASVAAMGAVQAQPVDPNLVESVRDSKAHEKPSSDAKTVFEAPAGTDMVWIDKAESNGFYRVIRRDVGPQGWIAKDDVKLAHAAKSIDYPVCAEALNACPIRGCAKPDTAEARDNTIKRTPPGPGPARRLSFEDIMALQQQADQHIGQGPDDLSKPQRQKLEQLRLEDKPIAEGDRVVMLGYVAKGSDGLHVNNAGESVNCMLKKPADNDFHIPLVAAKDDSEFRAIVVEMIPQDRPDNWTIDALKAVQASGAQVRVEGALSYDKVHFVNDDPDHPLKEEPDRRSLWEIHPITSFRVCAKDSCDVDDENDWKELGAK